MGRSQPLGRDSARVLGAEGPVGCRVEWVGSGASGQGGTQQLPWRARL